MPPILALALLAALVIGTLVACYYGAKAFFAPTPAPGPVKASAKLKTRSRKSSLPPIGDLITGPDMEEMHSKSGYTIGVDGPGYYLGGIKQSD